MKFLRRQQPFFSVVMAVLVASCAEHTHAAASRQPTFAVGFAKRDITPRASMPMWGYGDRHAMLSDGALDALYAKAIVIHAGDDKLAIVGLDLGRGPTRAMTEKIRREISAKAGIAHVMVSGSHTHHGPCVELLDRKGYGKGKFDDAIAYNRNLPDWIIEAILEADKTAQKARLGVAAKNVALNRNRQSKRSPKALDPMLAVMRFDDEAGKPIAVLVNFAAHPVMTDPRILKFSADFPGHLENKVERDLNTNCVFMQGAAGDLSPNPTGDFRNPKAYGEELAAHVAELLQSMQTETPQKPSIQGKVDEFLFPSRVDFNNPLIMMAYGKAFFPELIQSFAENLKEGIPAQLSTVVLNGQIALVGGSGEFFCSHSKRLKQRSYLAHTLFFGYCNDHGLYFPTIEAASEGGYGVDPPVSPVALGSGEKMMNRALINIYTMTKRFAGDVQDLIDLPKKP